MAKKSAASASRWSLSQPWFVYANLAATLGAFALLYAYVPARRECADAWLGYNATELATPELDADGATRHRLLVVTDLDHDSRIAGAKRPAWRSILKRGTLTLVADERAARVEWHDARDVELRSELAQSGRAMELSDIKLYNGHLCTADDRTGIVYKINEANEVVPWLLLSDGPGNVTKGFKAEWLAVKDRHLYVGGLGKEWTTTTGEFVNYHPMYVKRVNAAGAVEHIDWTKNYLALRDAVGIKWPGYMIHEAVQWSDVHQRWFFLPRRASHEVYDEGADETRGTNLLLVADATFARVDVHRVGALGDGARGYSAFQFLPGTRDELIVALKSEEKDGKPVGSYISVFAWRDNRILLDDAKLNGDYKFEGIGFA